MSDKLKNDRKVCLYGKEKDRGDNQSRFNSVQVPRYTAEGP